MPELNNTQPIKADEDKGIFNFIGDVAGGIGGIAGGVAGGVGDYLGRVSKELAAPSKTRDLRNQIMEQQLGQGQSAIIQQAAQSYQNLAKMQPEQQGQMKGLLDKHWMGKGIQPDQLQLIQQGVLSGQGAFGGIGAREGFQEGSYRTDAEGKITGKSFNRIPDAKTTNPYGDMNEIQDIQARVRAGTLNQQAATAMMGEIAKQRGGDPASDLYKMPSPEDKSPTKAEKTNPAYWTAILNATGEPLYTPDQANKMAMAYAKDPGGTKENLKQASSLRKEYQSHAIYANHQVVMKSAAQMEAALKRSKDGTESSRLASDQALGVLFQKMLDPTSVVRESEYARTAADAAVLSRIKAILPQLAKGGLKISDGDRQALFDMADDFLKISKEKMDEHNSRYSALAKGYEVNPSLVVEKARGDKKATAEIPQKFEGIWKKAKAAGATKEDFLAEMNK